MTMQYIFKLPKLEHPFQWVRVTTGSAVWFACNLFEGVSRNQLPKHMEFGCPDSGSIVSVHIKGSHTPYNDTCYEAVYLPTPETLSSDRDYIFSQTPPLMARILIMAEDL